MSIDAIPNVQFIRDTDRCYPYALDFVVASAALGRYLNAYRGQSVTTFAPHADAAGALQYPTLLFAGTACGKNLEFVPHDLLTNVLVKDTRSGAIPYLSPAAFSNISGSSSGAMAETLEGFAQAMFTRYYEDHLSAVVISHGRRNQNAWPSALQFAAVVRDAMSHGGSIHMFPSVTSVSHFNLNYSSSDNGRKILHNDLTCADIFYLMLDMDAAF